MKSAIIASRNKAKIIGARKALRLLGIRDIRAIAVKTWKEQPIGFNETLELAIYRAEKVLEHSCDLGVGIEGGVLLDLSYPMEGQVAVAISKDGKVGVGVSIIFPLPRRFWSELNRRELGKIMRESIGVGNIGSTYGAIGYLTQGAITRIELSYQAVLAAILPFIKPSFYGNPVELSELKKILKNLDRVPNKYVQNNRVKREE